MTKFLLSFVVLHANAQNPLTEVSSNASDEAELSIQEERSAQR